MKYNYELMMIQSFLISRLTELWGSHKYEIKKEENSFKLKAKVYTVSVIYNEDKRVFTASVTTDFCNTSETTRNIHELTDFITTCVSDCYIKYNLNNMEYLLK